MTAPILILLIPTIVCLGLLAVLDPRRLGSAYIWVGIAFGMLAAVPAWILETSIDNWAANLPNAYWRLFTQEVIAAAVLEELLLGLGIIAVYLLYRKSLLESRNIIAAAVALAIGFMTVENTIAVFSADNPLSESLGRLLSIPAGHVSLQLVMGYFAANAILGKQYRSISCVLMFLVPIAIHGWGDFAYSVFQYQANLHPDASTTKQLFSCWILALVAYVLGAVVVLWKTRRDAAGEIDFNTDKV